MKKSGSLILIISILFISLASATIQITQPLENYNFGDSIFTTVTVNPSVVSGSFEINLVCENTTANVYKISPAESAFSAGVEQKINHKIILTKEYLGNVFGTCYLVASIGKEVVSSNSFSLSSDINLNVKTDKYSYEPGEAITITIDAVKANGKLLNGFVDVSGSTTFNKQIVDGHVQEIFTTIETLEAGKYDLTITAYDSDDNGILNQKEVSLQYEIKQIARSIAISLANTEFSPGNEFEFGADLYDQSGKVMNGNLSALVISPSGEENQIGVNSGSSAKLLFLQNSTPGNYRLVVSIGTLSEEKDFSVLAVPKIEMEILENSSIFLVRNVGNAPFDDYVNVSIGENSTQTLKLNILPGEERRFSLSAPEGTYGVKVAAGNSTVEKQVLLTGSVIRVNEYNGLSVLSKYPLIWGFIALLIILLALVILRRFKKTTNYKDRIVPEKKENITVVSAKAKMKKDFVDLGKMNVSEAESTLNMKGSKDFCSIVSVSVKNMNALGNDAKAKLSDVVSAAKDKKAVVEWKQNHILIIFSPMVTKTYKNEISAAKAAWKIKEQLDEYNRRFNDKINFNIGINCGEMVSSLASGKLNYTSLGSTILAAKRVAESDAGKVLITMPFRQKVLREIKVNKINDNVFEITRIADVEANSDKLKELLKRNSFSTGRFEQDDLA